MTPQEEIYRLMEQQVKAWEQLRVNHEGLRHVRTRSFDFGHFHINMQFNPRRIISSGAKVDQDSIDKRPCFLCADNRPGDQQSVFLEQDYEVLCNPFPIFPKHFTIAKTKHVPQRIEGEFSSLLKISSLLPEMVIFYNGPACGASAPDHMHFQAGNRGLMPIEKNFSVLSRKYGKTICQENKTVIVAVDDGLRRFLSIESSDVTSIEKIFSRIFQHAKDFSEDEEPMMNLLVYFSGYWQVLIFLRERHRPSQYFLEGDEKILFSPASVDMGGTLIIPLEKDFDRINRQQIRDMIRQVSLSSEKFKSVNRLLEVYCDKRL